MSRQDLQQALDRAGIKVGSCTCGGSVIEVPHRVGTPGNVCSRGHSQRLVARWGPSHMAKWLTTGCLYDHWEKTSLQDLWVQAQDYLELPDKRPRTRAAAVTAIQAALVAYLAEVQP